jgi:threonine dehydrogenase-like Zn-dependent dehydrogenase
VVADEARAFWIAAPGRGEIRAETLPAPAADEVVVRALFSGVSRGSEALVFQGRVPASEHDRMRAPFQAGAFPSPVKYGYASVGTVERGPSDLEGRNVFTLYPHQTRYVVPAAAVSVLPDHVPPQRRRLRRTSRPRSTACGTRDRTSAIITVIGAGAVGCLAAWIAGRIVDARRAVDVKPQRAAIAPRSVCAPSRLHDRSRVVIHASRSASGPRSRSASPHSKPPSSK